MQTPWDGGKSFWYAERKATHKSLVAADLLGDAYIYIEKQAFLNRPGERHIIGRVSESLKILEIGC